MEEYIEQISVYFAEVPLWPFYLLAIIVLVSLAIEMVNRKRREDAIAGFREMFEIGLPNLYPKHIQWPENVNYYLCSRLPDMQQNFEVLRLFIPQKQLRDFNFAWNRYCDFCRNITDEMCSLSQPSSDTSDENKTVDNRDNLVKEFHQIITDLLEFAESK